MSFLRRVFNRVLSALGLEGRVAALGSTLWLDATETYAKSKVAARLTRTSSQYFRSSATDFDFGSTDFSLVFCISLRANTANIIFQRGDASPNLGFGLQSPATGYKIRLIASVSGSSIDTDYTTTGDFIDGSSGDYGFLVVTHENGVGFVLECYNESGVQQWSESVAHTGGINSQTIDTLLGAANSTTPSVFTDTDFDLAAIFSKKLTSTEITALINSGDSLTHKDLDGTESFYPNIVAWYDFNTPTNFGRNYAEESHAVKLDGSADYFDILQASATDFNFGNGTTDSAFSIGGWVKFNAQPSGTVDMPIFFKNREYLLSYNSGSAFAAGANLYLILNNNAGGNYGNSIGAYVLTTLTTGTWYHLAVTYDGSSSSGGISIYINGVAQSLTTRPLGSYTAMSDFGSFRIGGGSGGMGLYGGNNFMNGSIDEAFVYSGELDETTHGEISTLYNGGIVAPARTLLPTGNTATLVSDWSFNAQNVADIGKDSYGSNDLTPNSILEADLVGGVKDARTQYCEPSSTAYFNSTDSVFELEPNTSWSVTFWHEGNFNESAICPISKEDAGSGYMIGYSATGFQISIRSSSGNRIQSQYSYPTSNLVLITVTYDGLKTNDGILVYYDNVLQTRTGTLNQGTLADTVAAWPSEFEIYGATSSNISAPLTSKKIYSLTIWDTVISSSVRDEIFNNGKDATIGDFTGSKTNLVAWYDFENSAALGKDSHTGGLDLTVNGSPTVGLVRKGSLDLLEVGSPVATTGHIEGKAAGYDGVTLVTGRSGGVNAQQLTITEIATWYTDNYIRFTGSDNLDTTANIDLSGDFTIICRCRQSNIAEDCYLLSTSTTIWNNNTSGKDVVLGVTATEAHTQNKWQTISIKSDSGTISFRKSRLPNGSGTRNATVVTSTTMTISDITMAQNFDLRGLFVVERALPDSDIALVEEYFQTLDVETLEVELSEVGVEVILEQLGSVTFKELGVEIVFEEV